MPEKTASKIMGKSQVLESVVNSESVTLRFLLGSSNKFENRYRINKIWTNTTVKKH